MSAYFVLWLWIFVHHTGAQRELLTPRMKKMADCDLRGYTPGYTKQQYSERQIDALHTAAAGARKAGCRLHTYIASTRLAGHWLDADHYYSCRNRISINTKERRYERYSYFLLTVIKMLVVPEEKKSCETTRRSSHFLTQLTLTLVHISTFVTNSVNLPRLLPVCTNPYHTVRQGYLKKD